MQIISELEGIPQGGTRPVCRLRGLLQLLVGRASSRAGSSVASPHQAGGWVNDSAPEAEFLETVNKSKAMLKAVALAETFAKTP